MERALVVGLLLLAVSAPASAGDFSLLINGHAMHLESSKKQKNEDNLGVGLQYDLEPRQDKIWFAFGTEFQDSRNNTSYTAGGGVRWRYAIPGTQSGYFDLGGAAFLMTRETYQHGSPFPALLPVASIGFKPVALNITYIPKVDPHIIPLVFFEVKYSID